MKKKTRFLSLALAVLTLSLALTGCMRSTNQEVAPTPAPADDMQPSASPSIQVPDKIAADGGAPQLTVFDVNDNQFRQMDIESYVEGVLAGEMRNDWPIEALKAQAILARTFVLKFVAEKESQYEGADISTDIKEAQAYDEKQINERIVKAVEETRGLVMSAGGEIPYAWFHAHAGGQTDLATVALEYGEAEPKYIQSVESKDSDKAPTAVKNWTVDYTAEEVGAAAAKAGVKTGPVKTIEIGEKGQSGRAITLNVNGKAVSAPALRIALGSKEFKSTLLKEVSVKGGKVTFAGSGYGHGVGMSQWGAYGMAEEGAEAEQIVKHYFKDVNIERLWD